jgi:peptidoglycan hydrolase CwlO-like protein
VAALIVIIVLASVFVMGLLTLCLNRTARNINQLKKIMATQAELTTEVAAITPQITAIGAGISALNAKVAELEAAIASAGNVTPELQAAVDALKAEVVSTAALLPQAPAPAPAP